MTGIRAHTPSKFKHVELSRPAQTSAGIPTNHERAPRSPRVDALFCIGTYADVYRRIRSPVLYFYPRRNLRYACSGDAQAAASVDICAGCRRIEYKPGFMLLPYVTTNCRVHFKFDIFTYYGQNKNVNFSMNLTEKRLSYQNCRFIFINLRLLVVNLTYSPGYDTSNIPMYIICSWMMANNDWKIAAMVLFLGST